MFNISPGVISSANLLRKVAILMDWCQPFPQHSVKGYTLDLLFASTVACEQMVVDDQLVIGDPLHHECAFFKVKCQSESDSWFDSANKISNNFNRENFEVINAQLDMDWERFFGDSSIDKCLDKFYLVLHTVIDSSVPNWISTFTTYPPWYTKELKNLIFEKKRIHIKWKAVKAVRLQSYNYWFLSQLSL